MLKFIALPIILSACTPSPSKDVIDALAKDPATVDLTISTIYGKAEFHRAMECKK